MEPTIHTMQTEIVVAFIGLVAALAGSIVSAVVAVKNKKNAIDGEFKQKVDTKLDKILQQSPVLTHRVDMHDRRIDKNDDAIRELQAGQARLEEGLKSAHKRVDGLEQRNG